MHEVSMRKCARITRSVWRIGIEANELPTYEGLPNLASLLTKFEEKFTEQQCLSALDFVLKATHTIWWVAHKESISEWPQCRRLLLISFRQEINYTSQMYTILTNPVEHIEYCRATWEACPQHEWVCSSIHTYIRHDTKKLVYLIWIEMRDYWMGWIHY